MGSFLSVILQLINSLEDLEMFFFSAALVCRLHRCVATLSVTSTNQFPNLRSTFQIDLTTKVYKVVSKGFVSLS